MIHSLVGEIERKDCEMTETLNTLAEQLRHPDQNIRSYAATTLGGQRDVQAVDLLLEALAHETEVMVREDITWSLVRLKELAFQSLVTLLKDANPAVRHHAAHTLGKIGDRHAADALMQALHDTDAAVVMKTAFALGQIGDERAIPALVGVLGHEDGEVRSALVNVLDTFGSPAVQPLMQALEHERWQVREQAADALGVIGSREALPALVKALQDPQWQVRFSVVTALGYVGGIAARNALQPLQNDPDYRVRTLAPKVLQRIKG